MILTDEDIDRIIEMAWEDRTPFEAIEYQFGLREKEVIEFMRFNSLPSNFCKERNEFSPSEKFYYISVSWNNEQSLSSWTGLRLRQINESILNVRH